MGVRYNDPLREALRVIGERYPDLDVDVWFAPNLEEASAAACFPDDGSPPFIELSDEIPVGAAPNCLAHEVAHIVVGIDAMHGPAWEAEYRAIMNDICRAITGQDMDADDLAEMDEQVDAARQSDADGTATAYVGPAEVSKASASGEGVAG